MRHINKRFLIWGIILGLFYLFYCYQLYERTSWGVEQSFMFWGIKKVAVDHQITLIGNHFFSLVQGPIYRTPYFDWIIALPMLVFGLRIAIINYVFVGAAFLSLIFLYKTIKLIGGQQAGYLAALLYAGSWFTRVQSMQLWNVALMIFLMSLILYLLFVKETPSYLGLVVGAGFSLHLVVIWIAAAVVLYWLIFDRERLIKKLVLFGFGMAISLGPLILFNLRHNFIMKQGLINLFTGKASGYQAGSTARFRIMAESVGSLIGETLGFGSHFYLSLGVLVLFTCFARRATKFLVFFWLVLAITLVGIYSSGRVGFSSLHYGLHLLPLVVGLLALALSRYRVSSLVVVGLYLIINISQFQRYQVVGGLVDKLSLAKNIYQIPKTGVVTVKFTQEDVLSYDAVFYEAATQLNIPYNKVSLLERWDSAPADIEIP